MEESVGTRNWPDFQTFCFRFRPELLVQSLYLRGIEEVNLIILSLLFALFPILLLVSLTP